MGMCVYSKYIAPLLMKTHLDVCQPAIDSRRPPVFTGPFVNGPQVTLVMASLFCHVGKQFLIFTVTPSKIKIETNQCIKSRIYERKEDKHAKIQVRFFARETFGEMFYPNL